MLRYTTQVLVLNTLDEFLHLICAINETTHCHCSILPMRKLSYRKIKLMYVKLIARYEVSVPQVFVGAMVL